MKRAVALVAVAAGLSCGFPTAYAQHMNSSDAPCRNTAITVEVADCFVKAAGEADHRMNTVYQQVLSVLLPEDQRKLKASQRLWVQFRDTTCAAERDLYKDGTGAYPAYVACIEEETRLRTTDLETTYRWRVRNFTK